MGTRTAAAPHARSPWALYVGLTLVVWGLFALDRGLWHDDVQVLFRVFAAPARGEGWFPVVSTPTRRLLQLPSVLALASGQPRLALELMAGLSWLLTAVLVERLTRRLRPGAEQAARLAAVLTLVATPDFFTNALVGLAYQVSIVACLAAVLAGLAWLQGGGYAWLAAAALALNVSLWTTDAALPAWLLAPLLWWSAPGARAASRHRRVVALLTWYGAALAYLIVFAGQFASASSYVQRALVPVGPGEYAGRLFAAVVYNFEPWRWAFERPLWQPAPDGVVPLAVRLALALVTGAVAAAWLFVRRRGASAGGPPAGAAAPNRWLAVGAALLLTAASNAAFAAVYLAEFFCRTHLLSRVWASLATALLFDWAWTRRGSARPARRALAAAAAAWIALGVAGGLERQDYFAGYARRHRQELRSILDAAPRLAPDAHVVLRVPARTHYIATEAGYLARAWMVLLHEDVSLECRVYVWSTPRGTACTPHAGRLTCRGERSPDCPGADDDAGALPYEGLVILEYVPESNRYVLRQTLHDEVAVPHEGTRRYRPEARIDAGQPTTLARRLVYGPQGVAGRLWPADEQ